MCPCDLSRLIVCGYHAREIETVWREEQELAERFGSLSLDEALDLRILRAQLNASGLAVEIVVHQIKLREMAEASA